MTVFFDGLRASVEFPNCYCGILFHYLSLGRAAQARAGGSSHYMFHFSDWHCILLPSMADFLLHSSLMAGKVRTENWHGKISVHCLIPDRLFFLTPSSIFVRLGGWLSQVYHVFDKLGEGLFFLFLFGSSVNLTTCSRPLVLRRLAEARLDVPV